MFYIICLLCKYILDNIILLYNIKDLDIIIMILIILMLYSIITICLNSFIFRLFNNRLKLDKSYLKI